jgi:hypothetical protein
MRKGPSPTTLAVAVYLAVLLWINAFIIQNVVISCFDLGTAVIFTAAVILGGEDGRA